MGPIVDQGNLSHRAPWYSAPALLPPVLRALTLIALLTAIYSSGRFLLSWFPMPNSRSVLHLCLSGLLFSALAALLAWPFALTTALVLVNERGRRWAEFLIRYFRGLAFVPTLIYGYVFCSYFGPFVQDHLFNVWVDLFDPQSLTSQWLAFAGTVLLYPLSWLLSVTGFLHGNDGGSAGPLAWSVEQLYLANLNGLSELAVESFSSLVIVFFLAFLLTPIYIILIYQTLASSEIQQTRMTVLSLGASPWETLRISGRQHLRRQLSGLFSFGLARAFFEGVGIFVVLNYFFLNGNYDRFFWAETFSAFVIKTMIFKNLPLGGVLALGGILLACHFGFISFYKKLKTSAQEELLR